MIIICVGEKDGNENAHSSKQPLFALAEDNRDPSAMCIAQKDREETEGSLCPVVIWF